MKMIVWMMIVYLYEAFATSQILYHIQGFSFISFWRGKPLYYHYLYHHHLFHHHHHHHHHHHRYNHLWPNIRQLYLTLNCSAYRLHEFNNIITHILFWCSFKRNLCANNTNIHTYIIFAWINMITRPIDTLRRNLSNYISTSFK